MQTLMKGRGKKKTLRKWLYIRKGNKGDLLIWNGQGGERGHLAFPSIALKL